MPTCCFSVRFISPSWQGICIKVFLWMYLRDWTRRKKRKQEWVCQNKSKSKLHMSERITEGLCYFVWSARVSECVYLNLWVYEFTCTCLLLHFITHHRSMSRTTATSALSGMACVLLVLTHRNPWFYSSQVRSQLSVRSNMALVCVLGLALLYRFSLEEWTNYWFHQCGVFLKN